MNPNPVFKQSQESHHNCHPPLSTNTILTTKEKNPCKHQISKNKKPKAQATTTKTPYNPTTASN